MGTFEILDELMKVVDSSRLNDRMQHQQESVIAELEALGERGDALTCLELMREAVGRDSAKLAGLEQMS
ncbi:hypothetical protein Tco_1154894 [Tanacetum coccineum]